MTTMEIGKDRARPRILPSRQEVTRRILLGCGIAAPLLYLAINVIVPMQYDGYSLISQTVSELSAIDAPTRPLWVLLVAPFGLLLATFGWGIWTSARHRPLRIAGGALVANGLLGFAWPPMHMREVLAAGGGTLTDTLHIVFAMVTILLMVVAIGFGAVGLGKRFSWYSIATLTVLVVFGALTGMDAPRLSANLPTPLVGVWERINIGAFMLWLAVLATALLGDRRWCKPMGVEIPHPV